MKTSRSAFILMPILLLAVVAPMAAQPGSGTVDPAQCAVMAWSPEMFSFYGDKQTVLEKFRSLDRNLLKHRVYAFVVESKDGSSLTFFELDKNGTTMDLASMTGGSFRELSDQITNGLLENNGEQCAGMLSKELVQSHGKGRLTHTSIPRPANAGNAFEHALSLTAGDYVRATFFLFC